MPVVRFPEVLTDLRTKILDGTYPAGEPLPHTDAMKETYGVGAHVITRAMRELKAEGLIWRVANRGMIVQGPAVVIEMPMAITRMHEVQEWALACRRAGTTGHLTPVSGGFRHDTATTDVAQELGLDEGTPIATWESHGTIAQQVVCIDHTYVSRERKDAGPAAFDVPAHAALVDLRMSVRPATTDEARTMKISRGSPVLDVIRITRDDTGPVQMQHRALNPQRVRLVGRGLAL
ncbi:GntR family transcriptional regulator (plasmid) [Microtetraspora malaysiensis]|uniref:GntR family transcriptional regulator n=1 Tax=Microtetraspora malaysiensis TaxID=161358 RepID=UPI003D8AA836